jgi:hypothetical protein
MPTINASFSRDNNRVPITTDGIISTDTQVLTGNNATVAVPLFHVTGSIEIRGIWGVVTADLGANHTAAYWRLNDQTAQANITLNTGTTLSAIKAGSVIVKKGLASAALTKLDNAAGVVSEPTTLETEYFSPFVFVKKTGATTDVEYVYSTTDTPTSGTIQFFLRWLPVSVDANVTPI